MPVKEKGELVKPPPRGLKYMLVTTEGGYWPHLMTTPEQPFNRPGVYQWAHAFGGPIKLLEDCNKKELQDCDIIHFNIFGKAVQHQIASKVREIVGWDSKTKLIANLDYPPDNIENYGHQPSLLKEVFSCDFLWAQEPFQRRYMQYLIDHAPEKSFPKCPFIKKGLKVSLIPHPADVLKYQALTVDYESRLSRLVCCFHRYDGHKSIPALLSEDLNLAEKILLGWTQGATTDLGSWDLIGFYGRPHNWRNFVYSLAHAICAFEYYTVHSQSRFVVEAAALEVPCVGTSHSYNMKRLFPFTCHEPDDFEGLRASLEKLCGKEGEEPDLQFKDKVVSYARKHVEEYRPEIKRAQLLDAMRMWGITFG